MVFLLFWWVAGSVVCRKTRYFRIFPPFLGAKNKRAKSLGEKKFLLLDPIFGKKRLIFLSTKISRETRGWNSKKTQVEATSLCQVPRRFLKRDHGNLYFWFSRHCLRQKKIFFKKMGKKNFLSKIENQNCLSFSYGFLLASF